ncbi:TIGR02301 family protein [Blastochloris viridis]|uniref:TIGR02301 family protein n=1 Tax=Blastochloris viridis TaxID=1079 RepID=A0A0H5BDR3_BLAVI|nr:TIGR02301 family protein [Blastochloris viridis]ALK09752.1 hypothetical protein BVIR_1982 [Blastochloris viridis]BAS00353.1 hypothetical protein BV133_2759 [Blastochloris viridis]CUU42415.1 hypothetical protein BVIRIDIS_14270 [Blastochloris viridis]
MAMWRHLALLLVLLAASPAEAQLRPPGSVGGPPGPPPPPRGWFFFDLFAPRRPPPPPQMLQPSQPTQPRHSSGGRSGQGAPGPKPPAEDAKPAVALPLAPPPPYEGDLMRIAEIMGALHYLRPLCGAPEGQRWRNEMQALIEAEAQSEDRKDKLTRGFNSGYVAFERTYRSCTPAATLAVERYLSEGSKLAHDVVARYSN